MASKNKYKRKNKIRIIYSPGDISPERRKEIHDIMNDIMKKGKAGNNGEQNDEDDVVGGKPAYIFG